MRTFPTSFILTTILESQKSPSELCPHFFPAVPFTLHPVRLQNIASIRGVSLGGLSPLVIRCARHAFLFSAF